MNLRYILKAGPLGDANLPGVSIELQVENDPHVLRTTLAAADAIKFGECIIEAAHIAIARHPPSSKRKQ